MKVSPLSSAVFACVLVSVVACKEKTGTAGFPTTTSTTGTTPIAMVSVEGKKFHCMTSMPVASDGGQAFDIAFSQGKFTRVEETEGMSDDGMPKTVEKKTSGTFSEDAASVKAGPETFYKKDTMLFPGEDYMKLYSADSQIIRKINAALDKSNAGGGETPGLPRVIQYCDIK